jgi:proteasome lid subunit RPN8/RPN11
MGVSIIGKYKRIRIPISIFNKTLGFFQDHGRDGQEAICLWAGRYCEKVFLITDVIFPKQQAGYASYQIEEHEMHRINKELNDRTLQVVAQLHSHPCEAFHSLIDDLFPVITMIGGLSIVVPRFGKILKKDFTECCVYKLTSNGWDELNRGEVIRLFDFVR